MKTFNIGRDFSIHPIGRYPSDGPASGQELRENHLKEILCGLAQDEQLTVVLDDGVDGYGSSFLVEGFAGLVREGYFSAAELQKKLVFSYSDQDFEFYEKKIRQYISEATTTARI